MMPALYEYTPVHELRDSCRWMRRQADHILGCIIFAAIELDAQLKSSTNTLRLQLRAHVPLLVRRVTHRAARLVVAQNLPDPMTR
jgi:hypothetical protein